MSEERISTLRKLLDQRPEDPFIQYAIGIELVNDGKDGEASEIFDEVLLRFPDYVPTYLHAGLTFSRLEQLEKARLVLKQGAVCAEKAGDNHALSELKSALADL